MQHVILTPDGYPRQLVRKPLPTLKLDGLRMVPWNPPPIDPELQTVTPVLPVPTDSQAVEFVVADRPGAATTRRERAIKTFTDAIQKRLDDFARTRGYDHMLSACSYAASSKAKFNAEALRCVQLRDDTWDAAYAILAQVDAGTRPMPATLADIEADLPVLSWPP